MDAGSDIETRMNWIECTFYYIEIRDYLVFTVKLYTSGVRWSCIQFPQIWSDFPCNL